MTVATEFTFTDGATTLADRNALRRAFGYFPSGLVVVAALGDDGPVGLIASSFTTVSLDPPLVSVNIGRTSTTLASLGAAEHWGVTLLSRDQDGVADQFRRTASERFGGVRWAATDDGAVHIDEAAAGFHTRVDRLIPAGDHVIALLEVRAHFTVPSADPIVFHHSRLRHLEKEDPR